ncbi:MAG TPA: phospholipase D-like domain-containing protein [Tepidisphaeraceae bacterium]|nr:phospholipase D-like domain-containing protein [Tepidisphaeraceae bacterium]
MPRIYNQSIAHRFGVALIESLESDEWTCFHAAVAWVRRSGTKHLMSALREFLHAERVVRLAVGVDIENSSKEGLDDLLSLKAAGDCKTFVCHNESPSVTFHPKVYLFTNAKRARLIVGSNNLTEAGLFTNTEVALQIDAVVDAPVIVDMMTALESWQDPSEALVKELDQPLIDLLVERGYVAAERVLRERRRAAVAGRTRARRAPIFGSRTVTAPPAPAGEIEHEPTGPVEVPTSAAGPSGAVAAPVAAPIVPPVTGSTLRVRGYDHPLRITNVLLMRVRTARGGKQIQVPITLKKSAFLQDIGELISGRDGAHRPISATRPERMGGEINTYKCEMPELEPMSDPVIRLEKSATGVTFYAYDAESPQGRAIMSSLVAGRTAVPRTTVLTKPSDPSHSTWYRFV